MPGRSFFKYLDFPRLVLAASIAAGTAFLPGRAQGNWYYDPACEGNLQFIRTGCQVRCDRDSAQGIGPGLDKCYEVCDGNYYWELRNCPRVPGPLQVLPPPWPDTPPDINER